MGRMSRLMKRLGVPHLSRASRGPPPRLRHDPRRPAAAVELFFRIEQVSLHSKALTDGANVTSHEEPWSSARLPPVTVTFPASPHEPRRLPPPGRGRGA